MFDLTLHTENFRVDDINFIANQLKTILNINLLRIEKERNKYYVISIHGDCARKFLKYIGQCPISQMSYKWRDWKGESK